MTEEKLLNHDADGIKELDNPLPSWWVNMFYITIIFSFFYFVVFAFIPTTSGERADLAMADLIAADKEVKEVASSQGEIVKAVVSGGTQSLEVGKQVYDSKCFSCHGMNGEGLIGPNFTDNYWIHGKGEIEDMVKVILQGVPEKGMISWKPLLSDEEIQAVAAYIKTLQGTSPPNQKAAEGTLIE